MSVVNIQPAERAGTQIVIGIAGISGSGKTLTALLLAYGMANGDGRKVGFLCTENGRGRLYADEKTYRMVASQLGIPREQVTPYLIGELEPPFSPERYIEAIEQFQAAGVEALVVDSVSHEWNGTGGVLEIVDRHQKSIHGWKDGKPRHKKFVNALIQSNPHIFACIRASQKTDWKDPKNPRALGIMPVQQEEFMFEMTASMMMWDGGKARDVMKLSGTEDIFGEIGTHNGYLTAEHGRRLRAWIDGAEQLDPEIEQARNTLRTVSAQGLSAYRKAFESASQKVKRALVDDGTHDRLKRAAEDFDAQRKAAQPGGSELASLNEQIDAE